MYWIIVATVIILLLLINSLFIAGEFAAASSRRTRLQQMAAEGNTLVRILLPIVEKPATLDNYIATCQLGITASSLLLGYYAQATLSRQLVPLLAPLGISTEATALTVAATIILVVLTILQLLGELIPKSIGVRFPEELALYTVLPLRWSMIVFRPLIWFFNGSGQLVLRLMRVSPVAEHTHVHNPEEIRLLVQESGAGGLLNQEERRLLENTLQLRAQTVRQIMIPRTRMVAAATDMPLADMLGMLANSSFSRLPLYVGSVDNILGVVHLLDLLCLRGKDPEADVTTVMHKISYVPESLPIDQVLNRLQQERHHMAIVLDEYGGTAGMVAMEDLLEEIFGQIRDEFDREDPAMQTMADNRVLIQGEVLVEDLNSALDLYLPTDEVATVGGLILRQAGRVPQAGEEVRIQNVQMRIEEMDHNSVISVSLEVAPEKLARLEELNL